MFYDYKFGMLPKLFHSFMNIRLKDSEISGMSCPYLMNLYENEGITMTEVTRLVHFDKANTSRVINDLKTHKLVEIKESPCDKRIKKIFLSEKGKEKVKDIKKIISEWKEIILKDITKEEQEIFMNIIDRIIYNAKSEIIKSN